MVSGKPSNSWSPESAVLNRLNALYVTFNEAGIAIDVNRAWLTEHSIEEAAVIGRHYSDLDASIPIDVHYLHTAVGERRFGIKTLLRVPDAKTRWFLLDSFTFSNVESLGTIILFVDVTEVAEMMVSPNSMDLDDLVMSVDGQTGAYSRKVFDQQLRLMATESSLAISVVLVDIDSPTRGVEGPWAVEFVNRVKARIRRTDPLCRIGSTEFALLAAHNPDFDPFVLAEKVQSAALSYSSVDTIAAPIPCFVGYATYRRGAETVDNLLARARAALALSRASGEHTVQQG